MGNMYKNVHTPESANGFVYLNYKNWLEPSAANMALQIFNMVKGVIQTIIAIIVDTVPPIVIGKFPAKYAAKVGRTDDFRYKTCASIFPMCATGAAQVAQTFPICFPQCLAVLVACPGFWIDGTLKFSLISFTRYWRSLWIKPFINYPRIPPQYTSYDASKLYPEMCPKYDPNQDLPLDLYSKKDGFHSSIADASKEKAEKLPLYEKLIRSLEFHYAPKPKPCDCEKMKAKCQLHIPYPIHASEQVSETHYEKPELTSEDEKRCCEECKPIWEAIYSVK
uniref:Uncharacterized protein n=1 Tax=Theileria annulata TaxID=5874 RepID=A0A3B0MFK5_THEAN